MKTFHGRALALAVISLLSTACGERDEPLNVTIPFRAMVGNQPFACGQTYTGLGTTGTTYRPKDFRMYVHDVRLVTSGGEEVPVVLTEDGMWQGGGIVMLDFENKTGLCSNGTTGTNDRIVGTVPHNEYSALRFTVGVPFDKNHQAMESGKAPLGVSTLYWAWEAGHKFLRLDGNTTGLPNGHNLHLGSTGCKTSAPNVVTSCDNPNRFEVEISSFDPEQPSTLVVDVAALFARANLDVNQPSTGPGCMSDQGDGDCAAIFQGLGLSFGGETNPRGQVLFRKE